MWGLTQAPSTWVEIISEGDFFPPTTFSQYIYMNYLHKTYEEKSHENATKSMMSRNTAKKSFRHLAMAAWSGDFKNMQEIEISSTKNSAKNFTQLGQIGCTKGQYISKAIYGLINFPKKWLKLTIPSIFSTKDSECISFFGRIEEIVICLRDLLTFILLVLLVALKAISAIYTVIFFLIFFHIINVPWQV